MKLKTTQRAWGNSYDVLEVDFKPIRFRSKFYWNTALGKAFDIETSYAPMQSSSSAMNFGADLGFEKSLSKTFRLGAYTGVGLSLGKIGLEAKNIKYDLKYLTPKRSYSFSAKESLSIIDLIVPAYLESEIDLTDWLALDIDLGARFYLNRETNLGPYEISGAFGPTVVNAVFSSFKDPADYTRTAYDIALFGNLEFDFALIKKALYAFFSFSYEHGLNPVYDSGLRTYFDEATSVYPFYYSPISGTDNPMRSLIGSVRYSRKATCFAAGIKLKF